MVFTLSWFGTPSMHLHSGVGVVFPLNLTPTRQGCLHLFIGVGRRLVTKRPRARGRRTLLGSARQGACRGSVVLCVFLDACLWPAPCRTTSPLAVLSDLLILCGESDPLREGLPKEGAGYGKTRYLRGLCRRAPPGAGRDPLEEMFGVRMVDHEPLFFVFFETFGSCDSQLDCFTALRGTDSLPTLLCVGGWRVVVRMGLCLKDESTAGTDMTCQILLIKFLDVSAVLRACCASVHSFLVWVCLGKRLLGYPTKLRDSGSDDGKRRVSGGIAE
ncbi:hypothetical protein PAPYR_11475 [Paratrimastix pyriformis]|uniref:Uncharacterized protein n=1 Tax=Paratrimastix pyriformis TaxID=342808 RepID=A0ABQ8U678_9EUKA|nr:hypothetical protein PAPYR_11475 [Paratrimastix pyriformis]